MVAMSGLASAAVRGAVAGTMATGPMTAAMELLHRRLPEEEQYPLAPRLGTLQAAAKVGVEERLDEEARDALTLGAHFAYGAAAGAAYGLMPKPRGLNPAVAGLAFGAGVWASSYLGFLPAARLLTPATQHPPRRTAVVLLGNLLWGVLTALTAESLSGRRLRSLQRGETGE